MSNGDRHRKSVLGGWCVMSCSTFISIYMAAMAAVADRISLPGLTVEQTYLDTLSMPYNKAEIEEYDKH